MEPRRACARPALRGRWELYGYLDSADRGEQRRSHRAWSSRAPAGPALVRIVRRPWRVSMSRLPASNAALRLAAGTATVGLALVALWLGGVLFPSTGGETLLDREAPATLRPADASTDTPNPLGLQVGLRPGNVAPDFEFSDFDGRRSRLSEFRGGPLALNFWASWCIPCRAEMPDLEAALDRYEPRGLAIIGVNYGESYKTARRFLDEVGVALTAFAFDPDQDVVRRYAIEGMPTTYFLDRDGVITRVVTGVLTPKVLDSSIEEAIIGWGRVRAR